MKAILYFIDWFEIFKKIFYDKDESSKPFSLRYQLSVTSSPITAILSAKYTSLIYHDVGISIGPKVVGPPLSTYVTVLRSQSKVIVNISPALFKPIASGNAVPAVVPTELVPVVLKKIVSGCRL